MLTDDAFWLFHDDRSGRSRIPARLVGIALAATVLAELSSEGLLEVTADSVRRIRPGAAVRTATSPVRLLAPADPLGSVAAEVVARVAAEPGSHPLRDWITVLAQDSVGLIGGRMVATGIAVERTVRRGLRREVVFLPVDPIAAAWPAARLSTGVRGHRWLEPADVFLLGLAAATPLGADLLVDAPPQMRETALARVDDLPGSWRVLLETTRVAVASGVMTLRT
ncbi:MAG: GPP34 family phosphoprotein [Kineosporiaceae bacterium]